MHLELNFPDLSGVRLNVRTYDPTLDNIQSILSDVCEALHGHGQFVVSGFGDDAWPFDVHTELCLFLEQLPQLLNDIQAGKLGELDFYEQGVERVITFTPNGSDYQLTCQSLTDWQPDPAAVTLDRVALENMLTKARLDFIGIVRAVAPELLAHPWMKLWTAGTAYFG